MDYVTSADGTRIAFERSGDGPPLVLVHGSINDRRAWSLAVPAFAEHFSVYAMDRRGRGESGEPGEHQFACQIEDVAAVIGAAGAPVDLVGHSYGAHCALGAAAMAPASIKHLVLYEPPLVDDVRGAVAQAFEQNEASEAVAQFLEKNLQTRRSRWKRCERRPSLNTWSASRHRCHRKVAR
ncbi:MAG: alpha/beta hydrolase [Dehalococcoidia bacterium]